MKIMKSFGYSYIPIMKDKRVVGVFGKHTVFALTLDGLDNILFSEKILVADVITQKTEVLTPLIIRICSQME